MKITLANLIVMNYILNMERSNRAEPYGEQQMSNSHAVYDLVLYATNTGSLYNRHVEMAHNECGLAHWRLHVRGKVIPAYMREFGADSIKPFNSAVVEKVALDLQTYYLRHVKEF